MKPQGDHRASARQPWTLLLFLIVFGVRLSAQQQGFKQYGNLEGLTNLNIHALLQDRVGFLWVGTDNGLFRYDGFHFVEYGHTKGLPNTEVHALAQDPGSGQVWIGTPGGLARLEASGSKPAESWPEPGFSDIHQIGFDSAGKMYLLRSSNLLQCATPAANRPACQEIANGDIQSFVIRGRSLIFSRAGRLWQKNPGSADQLLDTTGLPLDKWQALLWDASGNLWARSNTRLFERCDHCTRFVDRSLGLEHNPEPHLAEDSLGHVFVSTLSGAVVFEREQRIVLSTGHGASDDAVGPLLVDREGNLWLGMNGGGLLRRLGQGAWSSWKREDGLLNNSVWAIRHVRDGSLWVGTSAGLTILEKNGRHARSLTVRDGLPSDRVLSIQPAPTGDVFLGTDPGGLAQLSKSGKLLRVYEQAAGLHGRISASAIDLSGRLWIVGSGGVFRSQPVLTQGEELRFDNLQIPLTTSEAIFRDVLIAEDGSVWVASSQGLSLYSGARWQTFTTNNGLEANDLDVIAESRGTLWVAYRDALGISRFTKNGDRLQGESITKNEGLSSNDVYALGFDRAGGLWATSDRGADVLEGRRWEHFDSSNGLVWDDTNSHALDTEATDGVWIGTSEGMSRFSLARVNRPPQRSPTVITEVRSGEQELSPENEPDLPYVQRGIGFRFANLDFANPPDTFRYRLSGYSHDWVQTQGHGVQFEALPAGAYLFEVEAQTSDGLWSSPGQFRFRILSPWWQKWYSTASCAIVVFLSVLGCWRLRMRALLRQRKRLQQQIKHQTNELRENYDRMAAIAYLDQLTSLPNRRKFNEEIRQRYARGAHLILLLVDLDQFKIINDTHGHDAGDAVLIATADRLQSSIQGDGFVARLGGDEFAILLNATDACADELKAICARVLEHCSVPIPFRERTLQISCSIGISISSPWIQTEDALYKAADVALYQVKRGGRNGFRIYTPEPVNQPQPA